MLDNTQSTALQTVAERHDPGQRCHYRQLLVGSSGPRLCGMALKVALVQLEQSPVEGPEDKATLPFRVSDGGRRSGALQWKDSKKS